MCMPRWAAHLHQAAFWVSGAGMNSAIGAGGLPPGAKMLHHFIASNRHDLVARVRERGTWSLSALVVPALSRLDAVPPFLLHLEHALVPAACARALASRVETGSRRIETDASRRGRVLYRYGFSVARAVRGYGDICQVVIDLASERGLLLNPHELHVLNRCLDSATAGALTALTRRRGRAAASQHADRQRRFSEQLRSQLNVTRLSCETMNAAICARAEVGSAIGARSLAALRTHVERLAEQARLGTTPTTSPQLIRVPDLFAEVAPAAAVLAAELGLELVVATLDRDISVVGDRQLLVSAMWRLLQNAFEFTPAHGKVKLTATATKGRVWIDVCDQGGGLPAGKAHRLLQLLEGGWMGSACSRSSLGIAIALRAAHANLGGLRLRELPGEGCAFTLDLPRRRPESFAPLPVC
jgi:signal transduction histidine kinase